MAVWELDTKQKLTEVRRWVSATRPIGDEFKGLSGLAGRDNLQAKPVSVDCIGTETRWGETYARLEEDGGRRVGGREEGVLELKSRCRLLL